MRTTRLALIAIACGIAGFCFVRIAMADPPAIPPDPLTDPAAAFDSFRALAKIGWPVTVLAAVVVAARLLSKLGGRFGFLAGKSAAVVAAVASVAAAAFDVLALGGSWASVVGAAVVAGAALWHPEPKAPKAEPK